MPFCLPNSYTGIQLAKVVVKYINEHPEQLNNPPEALVLEAEDFYFPCK